MFYILVAVAMAAEQPTPIAAQHPAETWAVLGASLTLIGLLVARLYGRLNEDVKDCMQKLENGVKRFEEICNVISTIRQQLIEIKSEEERVTKEIDLLMKDIQAIDRRVVILETEHKRCQETIKSIEKSKF